MAEELQHYNFEPTHQGYRVGGRTPGQAMMDALNVTDLPRLIPQEEPVELN